MRSLFLSTLLSHRFLFGRAFLATSSVESFALRRPSSTSLTKRSMTTNDEIPDYPRTSVGFEPRYNGPSEEEMTDKQREIRDAIVATRTRTGMSGPFGPWLAVPEIADPAQKLGRACRYATSLSFQESELVILLTGAKTKSHSEFDIHVGEALKSGWKYDMIEAIPRDDDFSMEAVKTQVIPMLENDRQKAIATFTAELLDTYSVSDETYENTKKAMDGKDSVLVEITSIAGYYTYVAYTLNVFRIPSQSADKPGEKKKREE
jgi:4-carboxymuconolactone decarboxylase